MSNYATLKAAIQAAVYTNGNGEITGAGLQAVLLQIVNTVGDGYVFKGVATAGTAPGTPDANVFYIVPSGTYSNFGSSYTVLDGSIGVFMYNGSWSKTSVKMFNGFDNIPKAGSDKVVLSDGVFFEDASLRSRITRNLVDMSRARITRYLQSSDGSMATANNDTWIVTDYIPFLGYSLITNSESVAVNTIADFVTYDENLTIQRIINGSASVTPQAGEVYVRATIHKTNHKFMMNYGSTLLAYEPYVELPAYDWGKDASEAMSYMQQRFGSPNILNMDTCLLGKYLTNGGHIDNASGDYWFVSDYIPTLGNDISTNFGITSSSIEKICVYDYNKNFIRTVTTPTYTHAEDAEYFVRVCGRRYVSGNTYPFPMVNYGSSVLPFEPWGTRTLVPNTFDNTYNGKKISIDLNALEWGTQYGSSTSAGMVNADGTIDYYRIASSGNSWMYSEMFNVSGTRNLHIKGHADITNVGSGNGIRIAVATGYTAADTFKVVGYVYETCDFDFSVDIPSLMVYEGFTDSISVWIINVSSNTSYEIHAHISEFEFFEVDNTTNIDGGDTLTDVLKKISASAGNEVSESYIVSPDGSKFILNVGNDGALSTIPVVPSKAALFGNSLINGFGGYGMAASDDEHDYYYLITEYIKTLEPNFVGYRGYISSFESLENPANITSTIQSLFLDHLDGDEKLVLVQLGDNVNNSTRLSVFGTSFPQLLASLKAACTGARIMVMGMWYFRQDVYSVIMAACKQYGVRYLDFAPLRNATRQNEIGNVTDHGTSASRTLTGVTGVTQNTPSNITVVFEVGSTEYTTVIDVDSYSLAGTTLTYASRYEIIASAGVASHPNDDGFKAIANMFLYNSGISDDENTYS